MKTTIRFIFAITFFNVIYTNAQITKYSNEFLAIGVGAQSLGISNTTVVNINDVSAGYYNPSGLARLSKETKTQVNLMHSEYFAGIAKYDYVGIARRIDTNSVLAFNAIRLGVDDIPNTLELIDANGTINYDRVKRFSAADYGFLLSYGRNLKPKGLSVGATAKVIRRTVGSFANAWGFGVDAGLQYHTEALNYGLTLRDAFGTFNAWTMTFSDEEARILSLTNNIIPQNSLEVTTPKLIGGISKYIKYEKFSAMGEINLEATFDGYRNTLIKGKRVSADPRLGLELCYANTVFLRGGYGNFQQVSNGLGSVNTIAQPSVGLGLRIKTIALDYALANVGQQVGLMSHVFSLKFDLRK